MIRKLTLLFLCLASAPALAQEFSADALIGKWEFTAYAESDAPNDRIPVNTIMEFRPDGTMITKMASGDVESSYTIDGNTLHYSGDGGDQIWTVHRFEDGESIVFNNRGALMYLERR